MLYKKNSVLLEKCPSCGKLEHTIFECNYLNVKRQFDIIIEKHQKSYQRSRILITRKKKKKKNSLYIKKSKFRDANENTKLHNIKLYKNKNIDGHLNKFLNSMTLLAAKKNFMNLQKKRNSQ